MINNIKIGEHTNTGESILEASLEARLKVIGNELKKGFGFVSPHEKIVTIFGSARFNEENIYYKKAENIARKLGKLGYAIITGGGPGIMEAGNRGAKEAGVHSIGLSIDLREKQIMNPYSTENMEFHYFFTRKVVMTFKTSAFIIFPGGYGTLNEFFETLALLQTKKVPPVPLVLIGNEYWHNLENFIRDEVYEKQKAINKNEIGLFKITDDEDEAVNFVKQGMLIA